MFGVAKQHSWKKQFNQFSLSHCQFEIKKNTWKFICLWAKLKLIMEFILISLGTGMYSMALCIHKPACSMFLHQLALCPAWHMLPAKHLGNSAKQKL